MEKKLPRNLYKKGGAKKLYSGGKCYEYSTVIVTTEDEYEEAMEHGYLDDFSSIMLDAPKKEERVIEGNFGDDDDF